jgi:predicted MFS family arabinose efflux permease
VRPPVPASSALATPSRRSWRALDWCIFFVADVQTGFGAFVSVYLTSQKWSQADIGLLLTVSGLASLIAQAPCGALVDATRSLRGLAAASLVAIALSACAFAAYPVFAIALASRLVLALASITLGLALVAISLGLSGQRRLAQRLGRNAAFASAGTGIAAVLMGASGYYFSPRAVFYFAGALAIPAIVALYFIRTDEISPLSEAAPLRQPGFTAPWRPLRALLRERKLVIFAACVMMFHLANAAMLPLERNPLRLS